MIDVNRSFGNIDGPVIVLSTGYEVEVTDNNDWIKHLLKALVGDIFVDAAKEYGLNTDDAIILVENECKRLSLIYKLPYTLLLLEALSYLRYMIIELDSYGDYRWEDAED